MSRMPRITGKDLLSLLLRQDFILIHVRGSHHYVRRSNGGRLVTLPVHSGRVLKPNPDKPEGTTKYTEYTK